MPGYIVWHRGVGFAGSGVGWDDGAKGARAPLTRLAAVALPLGDHTGHRPSSPPQAERVAGWRHDLCVQQAARGPCCNPEVRAQGSLPLSGGTHPHARGIFRTVAPALHASLPCPSPPLFPALGLVPPMPQLLARPQQRLSRALTTSVCPRRRPLARPALTRRETAVTLRLPLPRARPRRRRQSMAPEPRRYWLWTWVRMAARSQWT